MDRGPLLLLQRVRTVGFAYPAMLPSASSPLWVLLRCRYYTGDPSKRMQGSFNNIGMILLWSTTVCYGVKQARVPTHLVVVGRCAYELRATTCAVSKEGQNTDCGVCWCSSTSFRSSNQAVAFVD